MFFIIFKRNNSFLLILLLIFVLSILFNNMYTFLWFMIDWSKERTQATEKPKKLLLLFFTEIHWTVRKIICICLSVSFFFVLFCYLNYFLLNLFVSFIVVKMKNKNQTPKSKKLFIFGGGFVCCSWLCWCLLLSN